MTNKQKAGDGAIQTQIGVMISGIDEKRVREIVEERLQNALKEFSREANEIATERNKKFSAKLIKIMKTENALTAFADPSFQLLLKEAQKRAAATEREPDYDLLSELMLHRFKKGKNRNLRAGIVRAIEVIDQISDDALAALTVLYSAQAFTPTSGSMEDGLKALADLFDKLLYAELPNGHNWLDHLDILDAVRISSLGRVKELEEYWPQLLDGYVKKGIKIDSDNHKKALDLISKNPQLSCCLTKNSFDEDYVKIMTVNKDHLKKSFIIETHSDPNGVNFSRKERRVTEDEVDVLEKIYDLYDGQVMDTQTFVNELEKYPSLKKLRKWWNSLDSQSISVTSVGKVLAHSNAQRIDKTLPHLDQDF